MVPSLRLRPAGGHDADFLVDMLVEAVNWHPYRSWSRDRVLADPRFARRVAGWPRASDLGVVAEADGRRVAASWLRLPGSDEPGYGSIGPEIPELTMAVALDWRGRGIGRALLHEQSRLAAEAGVTAMALAVEPANFAVRLYLSEGFRPVASYREWDILLRELGGPVAEPPDAG